MKLRINRTLKLTLLVTLAAGFIIGMNFGGTDVHAFSGGPPASRTGAPAFGASIPAEQTCSSSGCHTGTNNVNDGNATFKITAPASYVPGQIYTLTVSLKKTTGAMPTAGFQLTALDSAGASVGTLADVNASVTFVTTGTVGTANRSYIEHQTSAYPTAVAGSGQADWQVKWTAPATRVGKITFFASGNAANGGGAQGDFIYTTSTAITPDVVTANSASATATEIASNGIGSAYGIELATSTVVGADTDPNAAGVQLPTTLGGTTLSVRDSASTTRQAPLFFVSPTQINYQVPNGTAAGAATVTIANGTGGTSTGSITVASVSPGVFTVTQNGAGLAAAQVQRVTPANVQTYEDIAQLTGGTWSAIPIDWKNPSDSLYLVLYGTGIRNVTALPNVSLRIGNAAPFTTLPAIYASSQGFFAGLDQVNILLPRTLVGAGLVDAVLTVDGKVANTVKLNFK
jgi:uncharacterized protein (TIGR03437 family)